MANHVTNYIELHSANDAAKDEFKRLFEMGIEKDTVSPICEVISETPKPAEGEEGEYEWFINNVGAKWAYPDDAGDDYASVISAWSPPEEFFDNLCLHLKKFDEDIKVAMTFDDECLNFVGQFLYNGVRDDFDYEVVECDDFEDVIGVAFDDEYIAERFKLDPEEDEELIWEKTDEVRDEFWELWHSLSNDWMTHMFNDDEE